MKKLYYQLLMFLLMIHVGIQADFVSTMKGIGHAFEDVGKELGSKQFWQGVGRTFGAAPVGYVYSFTILNDTAEQVYIGTQKLASFMGATFPIGGRDTNVIKPFSQGYEVNKKEYYFEMTINASPKVPTNHMPYMNSDALYVQDCINLLKKNSTKMNYFRTYIGKSLDGGSYVHGLRAESLGYADPSNVKDKNASVTMESDMSSVTFYNSTSDDIVVGYSSKRNSSLTKKDCDVVTVIEKKSFALLNATKSQPLNSGTLGLFEEGSDTTFLFPLKVLKGKTYTLEIYQDKGQSKKQMGLQGLMPGHYDLPTGRVRDITPVKGVFWYQSIDQVGEKTLKEEGITKKSLIDLPGQVWVVSKGPDFTVASNVTLGTAAEFQFLRPLLNDEERWFYFLYIDTTDTKQAEQFVENFLEKKIGQDVVQAYRKQSAKQVKLARNQGPITFGAGAKGKRPAESSQVPQALLIAAIQGALKLHQGRIVDPSSKASGYLLGADVFLPQGVGASSFYYQLSPSTNFNKPGSTGSGISVPTSVVKNLYAYTLGGKAPSNIPDVKQHLNFTKTVG